MTARASDEPIWLDEIQVRMLHAESISLFGGASGIRDSGLLRSALGRPQNLWAYARDVTLPQLAASYAYGLAKNHAFVDGNKRVALLAIRAFLFRNGIRFEPTEAGAVAFIEGLAAGSVSERELSDWIATNSSPRAT